MNKYQQALAEIKVKCLIQGNRTVFKFGDVLKKEVDVLQELVDRATPKKVLNVRNSNKGVKFGQCPNCKKDVMWIDYPYVCGHKGCAQLLDWGKKEIQLPEDELMSAHLDQIKEVSNVAEENMRLKHNIVRNYITSIYCWGKEMSGYDQSMLNLSGVAPAESTKIWNQIQESMVEKNE